MQLHCNGSAAAGAGAPRMLRSPPHVVRRCVSPPQPLQSSSRSAAEAAAAAATQSAVSPATAAVAYSADVAAAEWSRRPTPVLARLLEISAAFGGWYAKSLIHRDRQRAAADMRELLVELGPAFVKIGQALSSRPDVLPPEYIEELELLQDRIPPFSNDEALQVIEEELGVPWQQVFSSLSPAPVAAASLGQVYRGRLASTGAEVAVKVQRPGVVEAIGRDTYILRNLAAVARKQAKLNTDLPALVDEWASSLFKELDYRREAANGIRFAQLFSFMPEVCVPQMYTEWTTARVLVMEWVEGERLRTASQQAPADAYRSPAEVAEDLRLVEIGVRCSLEQVLEEGFYHADPHPGNLLKTPDGRLAYLDFGMMGSIQPGVRQGLIQATLHLVNREFVALADDFVALGLLPRGSNMDEVIPALTGVFQTALAGGVSNISFSTLSANLGKTMYKYSFRLPPYYTLLVRSLSVLEGIALASDPTYKVLGAAYPWVSRRLLLTTNAPELQATLDNLLYDSKGRFNFDRLESLLSEAAKARVEAGSGAGGAGGAAGPRQQQHSVASTTTSSSSSTGVVATHNQQQQGGVVSAAAAQPAQQQQQGLLTSFAAAVGQALAGREGSDLLVSSLQAALNSTNSNGWQQQVSGRGSAAAAAGGPLALVLSPEGRHIRGVLEDELAKGLDAAWRLNLDRTLDAASERLEGAVSFAVRTPLGSSLVPDWLQQQVQQQAATTSSSGAMLDASTISSSSSTDGRPDLIESLLNLPRLAGEDDRVQVEGLSRLAVQLAALSAPAAAPSQTTSTSSSSSQQLQEAGTTTMTAQQEANAVALQQVRQAALVLQWFASEVALLSPEAQREALALPMRVLSKFGSRLTARAVRAVLTTPSSTRRLASPPIVVGSPAGVANSSKASSVAAVGSSTTTPAAVGSGAAAAAIPASSSSSRTSSSGVAMVATQEPGNGKQVVASGGSSTSLGPVDGSSSNGSSSNGASSRPVSPLPKDSNGATRGGRMVTLADPAATTATVVGKQ